ncbi:MAG: hypothetical protein KDI88_03870 [Gammaproteobacteria bacterium]|nr:hypothetical protein [Gammaproteobacteria bacterium]
MPTTLQKPLVRISFLVLSLTGSPLAFAAPVFEEYRLNAAIVLALLGVVALGLGLRNLRELRYRPLRSLNTARPTGDAGEELHSSDAV